MERLGKKVAFDRELLFLLKYVFLILIPLSKVLITNTSFNQSIEKEATVGALEFEVLKTILNRESYLNRLVGVSKAVGRKYKPEVTDILDLIRASSMDVVEAIVKWREAKVRSANIDLEQCYHRSYIFYFLG